MAMFGDFVQGLSVCSLCVAYRIFVHLLIPFMCIHAGGLMFGWNALSLILKDQGVYDAGCAAERAGVRFLTHCNTHWQAYG